MATKISALKTPPSRWRDFAQLARIDRPIGSFLLLWPTCWALWLAGEGHPALSNLLVFTLGVFLMRSAGCVINDYADRHWDGQVSRTRLRPLPTGRVKPKEALLLFAALLIAAFLLVLFFTNPLTLSLAFAGALLAVIYPFMKRHTHLPQVFLGAAFGWAIPMAWAAEAGELSRLTWLLFIANLLWTVAYDTLYAMVDREDDRVAGIKSTAILFGDADRIMIGGLQALVLVILLLIGQQAHLGIFWLLGICLMAASFAYQQYLIRGRDRDACFAAFLNNNWAGFAVFAGLFLDRLLN